MKFEYPKLIYSKINIDNRGYIARPTDQRIKLGILFQDYVPNLPDLKAYLFNRETFLLKK